MGRFEYVGMLAPCLIGVAMAELYDLVNADNDSRDDSCQPPRVQRDIYVTPMPKGLVSTRNSRKRGISRIALAGEEHGESWK